jgi:hypothetical protein
MSKCACGKYPIYGLLGNTKRIWCSKCKPDDAVDVAHKICPCGKRQPSLGLPGDKRPTWCRDCPEKPKDAINVVSKKCSCGNVPSYGVQGDKRPTWCSKCKPDSAVNVKHNKCSCGNIPSYGVHDDKRPTWCSKCKPDGAIDVMNKKCPCGNNPSYGLVGDTKRVWCMSCKPDDAIDVLNKICPGYNGIPCPVRTFLMNGKEYCLSCDPDESRRLPRKKDEHAFFMFLEKHNIEVTQREYRIDYRCVETSKSHAFIDGVIITPDIVICLEVDEDAHRNYSCDEARTNFASHELLLAYPKHHISWVRVNPTIGNFDRSDKALRLRNDRYSEAVSSIRELLNKPRTEIIYIGYE